MSETKDLDYDKAMEAAVRAEKARLMTLFFKERASMTADYGALIKHTGGLVGQSMTYAYARGLDDAFKLLQKDQK